MTNRQKVNETAANLARLLTMMIRMPDAQIDYLFDADLIRVMHEASDTIVRKGSDMVLNSKGWYPGNPDQILDQLERETDE